MGKASSRVYAIFQNSAPAGCVQNKQLGEEFSLEVNISVSLRLALESNQPSLMAQSRAPSDAETALASSSPEIMNSALGLWNKYKLKDPQRDTICPNRLWVPLEGK